MSIARALVALLGCHTPPVHAVGARDVRCELAAVDRVVAAHQPVRVHVTVANHTGSTISVGRALDTLDADWIVDGRDGTARENDAYARIPPPVELSFDGPTGENLPRDVVVALAPQGTKTWTVDVARSVAESRRVANGVDISPMTLLASALAVPGTHALGLVVHSYPADSILGGDDRPAWETRCTPIEIEVKP